jgi:hypothetical protein
MFRLNVLLELVLIIMPNLAKQAHRVWGHILSVTEFYVFPNFVELIKLLFTNKNNTTFEAYFAELQLVVDLQVLFKLNQVTNYTFGVAGRHPAVVASELLEFLTGL